MLQGHQSWIFESKPVIIGSAAVGGPFEAQGNFAGDFDILHDDLWLGQDSFEKAEKKLLEQACETAIKKAGVKKEDIQFFLSGDLINQIIASSFTARTLGIPYLGIYGACSSSMEGLALASMMVDTGFAKLALAGTSSHNAASEKQYRYPTEYGAQKPPTAQWTVTGAGAVVVGQEGEGPKVTSATIGRVVDMGKLVGKHLHHLEFGQVLDVNQACEVPFVINSQDVVDLAFFQKFHDFDGHRIFIDGDGILRHHVLDLGVDDLC